jgi:hypothetical protein
MSALDEKVKAFLSVSYGYGDGDGSGYSDGSGDGYGDGYGDGSGSGSGSGDGDGYGYGSGSGSGDGDGYGYGYGDGYGSGYGYGSGDGYGSGYGYGYGDGDGSGIKSFNSEPVYTIDDVPTILRHVRGNVAHGVILNRDLTTTNCYVVKQDNIFAHGETLAKAMDALRDKLFEDMPAEERIAEFLKETEDGRAYPAQYFYDWHHRLTGSCDMGRRQFASDHGIDVDSDTMTLREFLALTKDAYGGSVIRKALEKLEVVCERT